MRLFALILFYMYGTLSILSAKYREDTVLCYLTPDQNPLDISHENNKFNSGIAELDNFLNSNPIINIEPGLQHTTSNEHSGNIYLNRIYRIYLKKSIVQNPNQLKDELLNFQFIHSVGQETIHKPTYIPNDPQYNQQWFFPQIQADGRLEFLDCYRFRRKYI